MSSPNEEKSASAKDVKTRTGKTINETDRSEVVKAAPAKPEPKYVGEVYFEYGSTINMGNFESQKVACGIRIPISDMKLADAAFEYAVGWVNSKLVTMMADLEAQRDLDGKNGAPDRPAFEPPKPTGK